MVHFPGSPVKQDFGRTETDYSKEESIVNCDKQEICHITDTDVDDAIKATFLERDWNYYVPLHFTLQSVLSLIVPKCL